MKFSCERCGKKYATAETPSAGRVYKIKCKACGHLIVVKASAGAAASATTEMRAATSTGIHAVQPHPEAPPELQLEIAPPEPAAPPPLVDLQTPVSELQPHLGAPGNGVPHHPDSTQEVSVSSFAPVHAVPPPPPADGGYVDLFAEPAKPAKPEPPPPPKDDPFLAAARNSLPEGYGATGRVPDPFASMREELRTPPPEPIPTAAPPPVSKVPHIAKPPSQKSTTPLILIGAGSLVLVGILAFVLLGGKKAPPAPPPAQQQVQAQPPAPPPPAPVAPAPVAPAPAAQPEPPPPAAAAAPPRTEKPDKRTASEDDRRAREEKREREREAREAKEAAAREAKDARERDRAARDAKAREEREAREARAREDREAREAKAREEREARERDRQRREQEKVAAASMGEPENEGLTQDQIQKVLSATRKAFENCIVTSGKSGEVKLDGRRVLLRLNIQTNGAVTYPTLDDVSLNGTDLGSCLKSAARLMVFPKFKGDTMHVEVPLVLAGGR